jgi:hypothetical protein
MTTEVDGGTGEDGGDVTFVGGKAVEQETSGETPDGDHGDELAAAKAAVKKALEEEGRTAAKEAKAHREKDPLIPRDRGPDGKFLTADPVEKEKAEAVKKLVAPEDDADASSLRKALAERKAAAQYKAEANAELERQRTEVRQFYAQLEREKAQVAAERQKLEILRKDPIRAIRENGWDPEEFILDIASDGTPEGQAKRQQRELQAQLKEIHDWKRQMAEDAQRQAQEAEHEQKRNFRQQVETAFLRTAMAEERHPHLTTFYKGHEVGLLAEADVVAEQYRHVTGKEATFGEIAEYLEERAAKWYKSMNGRTQAVPPVTQGRPTQGSATGKKSLSPAGSSERRTLGTNLADLDGDDRLEAARVAVRAAIHASGER